MLIRLKGPSPVLTVGAEAAREQARAAAGLGRSWRRGSPEPGNPGGKGEKQGR